MRAYDSAVITIGFGTLGIFIAYIIWYLNDNSIWVDQYITANTPIQEIMAMIIIIFILVGVLLAVMKR